MIDSWDWLLIGCSRDFAKDVQRAVSAAFLYGPNGESVFYFVIVKVEALWGERHAADLLLSRQRWVVDKQRFSVSPDASWQGGPWRRHRFPSHTIRTRRTLRGERCWHVPSKRREETSRHRLWQWDAGRRAEREAPRSWQEAEAEVRKWRCSLRGASDRLAAGDEATTDWMWVTRPGFHCASLSYLEPGHLNTACHTQGSGALFPRGVHRARRLG